ncbi:MAG TPA: DUF169 domain-containing protein [Bryobacteraceae bacterium]|jgi:uncharacterized protein (DUF169 family)|nr:DUF169 domain-containing protein [Bryobacteraceae bacterium]
MDPIQIILGLSAPPIAIGFSSEPPAGLDRWQGGAVPAGCVFWREAMKGRSFYTLPADHYNCAVGAHTHSIPLPPERGSQLEDTVKFMVLKEYLLMEEAPGIPVLEKSPACISYAPVDSAPFPHDLVLLAAKPSAAMMIYETALRAGAAPALANTLGRPACAVLPLTTNTGLASLSLGCMGNRTFTGLPDEELYVSIPGGSWRQVLARLMEIGRANDEMRRFYADHKAQFATA